MRVKESAGGSLLSIHNVTSLIAETGKYRQAILEGRFQECFEEMV